MSIKAKLTGSGTAPLAALNITGTVTTSLTSTGSTQATALLITDDINVVTTTASSTGVRLFEGLSAGDRQEVVNYGANALAVYPPVGGKINNGTLNASVSLAANKAGRFTCIDSLNFFYVISG